MIRNFFIALSLLSTFFACPNKFCDAPRLIVIFSGVILVSFLLKIAFEDISSMLISKRICNIGIFLGISTNATLLFHISSKETIKILTENIFAAIFIYALMNLIREISGSLINKEALGLGDAHLSALGAAWLGFKGIGTAIALAFVSAGIYSFVKRLSGSMKPLQVIPFAPFIGFGIWTVWLLGQTVWMDLWHNLIWL